jgi:type III restriction enzyme
VDVATVVAQVTKLVIDNTISIPRIVVVPKGAVTITFKPFKLDTSNISQQPVDQKILIQHLRTNLREFLDSGETVVEEERLEDYLVRGLVDRDDISYDDHADLLYDLAGQVVQKLRSYLSDEEAVQNVLIYNQPRYVQLIYNQMQAHRLEVAAEYEAKASKGFETPRAVPFSTAATEQVRNFRVKPEPLSNIPRMLFGGFARCLYPVQKFSSDPERRFAVLLEDEPAPLKWFKPARNQFKIFYRGGEAYEPDFVAETADAKFLCEPKRADDTNDPEVQAKARAAAEWCQHATQHETVNGGKPWTYVLIPHDAITPSASLAGLVAQYRVAPSPS